MRIYEHRMIDENGNYEVWYVDGDYQKRVDKTKPDYVAWITNIKNIPKTIEYVAPTEEELKAEAIRRAEGLKRDEYLKKWDVSQEKADFEVEKTTISAMDEKQVVDYLKEI